MKPRQLSICCARLAVLLLVLTTGLAYAQSDPGPRGGTAGAGDPIGNLTSTQQAFFQNALDVFNETDAVVSTNCSAGQTVSSLGIPCGEGGSGLGPTFNGNSCAMCHAEPNVGGSSPGLNSRLQPLANPQVALATLDGAHNSVPSFIKANGPVREARFISSDPTNINAALDGGVHGLYTVAGRKDAAGCSLGQPNFAANLAAGNVIFRIPTPTFGLGFVEATPDSVFVQNLASTASRRSALGIAGRLNTSGNDGTVTRFGWKAQNKSLLMFAGEAYNVEQGVTNELFGNERAGVSGCVFNTLPEDHSNLVDATTSPSQGSSDLVNFAMFMRLLKPPTQAPVTASIANGASLFNSVGCNLCHTTTLQAGPSPFTDINNAVYHPYSDFAIHAMGSQLNDGTHQGGAEPDEFRTAPLWGVGQRLFFMHDGRTSNLLTAIAAHTGGTDCFTNQDFDQFSANGKFFQPFEQTNICVSEADQVITRFNGLSASQKQDVLNFLRSL